MSGQELTPTSITTAVAATDAAAIAPFCQSLAAYSQGAAALDPGVMYQGLAAVSRVAATVQSGGMGSSRGCDWQAKLTPLPSIGRSLLLIEGESQLHLQLDSANQCVGGVWANPLEVLGSGCVTFHMEGNLFLVETPSPCSVPLPGPVSGWTTVPVLSEQPPEGGSSLLSSGMMAGAIGMLGVAAAGMMQRASKAGAGEPSQAPEKQWYYLRAGLQEGPIGDAALRKLLELMPPDTLVWNFDLPAWTSATDLGLVKPRSAPAPVKPVPAFPPAAVTGCYCPVCGAAVLGAASFCGACGGKLS